MTDLTVESETDEVTFPWTDKKASDMQSDVVIANGKVSGTLNFIEGGLSPSGPLSGDGYFIALKWSDPDEGVTSLKVGLQPSEGTGLVECIDDTDRNGVFKVTDPKNQVLKLISSNADHKTTQIFKLSGLELETGEG